MSSMEAARLLKAAAAALESAKRATLLAAVAVADASEGGRPVAGLTVDYSRAKRAEVDARRDYFAAVEARLQVADYRKARLEQAGRGVS